MTQRPNDSANCTALADQLVDYADGELTPLETARVERHLVACAECRREVAILRRWATLAGRVWREAAEAAPLCSAGFPQRRERSTSAWLRPAAAIAAGVCFIVAVLGFSRWERPPQGRKLAALPNAPVRQQAVNAAYDENAVEIDVEALVRAEAAAARLAASAEILAAQPEMRQEAEQADRYLARAYPKTTAGRRAAERLELSNTTIQ